MRLGEYAEPGVQPPQRDLGTEGHYEYGSRAGVWRLARIFGRRCTRHGCSSGGRAGAEPGCAGVDGEHGHDLLGHGWRWISLWELTREQEREHLDRAVATFERLLGGGRWLGVPVVASEWTRALLLEEGGFIYDSDSCADDLPYYVRCQGRPFLVVPYSKTYNDSRYLIAPATRARATTSTA